MPYKSEQKSVLIPRELKRCVKLSEQDKIEIVEIRRKTGLSYDKIAKQFGVSKTRVMQICNPEIEARQKKQYRERQKDGRYYNKEKHNKYVRMYRRYKHLLYQTGKLSNNEEINTDNK